MRPSLTRLIWPLITALWSSTAMAIEEPRYDVVMAEGAFEIRHYAPILIAETEVEGDMDEASSKGFRLIADFIFGNNRSPNPEGRSKIAMTAPVTVEPVVAMGAMTYPMTVEPQSMARDMRAAQKWRVHFVMPAQYTLASIPKPVNEAVTLKEIPSKYWVVHKYSGLNTMGRVQEKVEQTLQWAKEKSLTALGAPQLSRYDPPWTLPMFRRNEILLEISKP